MQMDQAEQALSFLDQLVVEGISRDMGDMLEATDWSLLPPEAVIGQLRGFLHHYLECGAKPEDHTYPKLRMRLLELWTDVFELQNQDHVNLRWFSLLYVMIGFAEVFARNARRAAGDESAASDHNERARRSYDWARRWWSQSEAMGRLIMRLEQALDARGLSRKHPDWGEVPAEEELKP